jgi:hypothetical protein
MGITLAVVGPLFSMTLTLLLFLGFLYAIYRFLRWLWTRLPSTVVSVQPDQLSKTLGLLVSLVFFPALTTFAWNTIQALIESIPLVIQNISSFEFPKSCAAVDYFGGDALSDCMSQFSRALAGLVGSVLARFVASLNLNRFPVWDFAWFFFVAVVVTRLVAAFSKGDEGAIQKIRAYYSASIAAVPEIFWRRLTFMVLVLVSFYLGLCALLAIPLFQDKWRSQQLTVEALGKALDPNVIKSDELDKRFPEDVATFRELVVPKITGSGATEITTLLNDENQIRKRIWERLQKGWNDLRSTAPSDTVVARDQAINAFTVGLEAGAGKKQTSQHYDELFLWHQRLSQHVRGALSKCQTALISFGHLLSTSTDELQGAVEAATATATADAYPNLAEKLQQQRLPIFSSYYDASRACATQEDETATPIPKRPSFADTLGPVGSWTRWLLETEQMPVVIIVGLVGFSLLGASVSRAVRASVNREEKLSASLTIDDLLTVIATGMTAAVVVFLAAYGGLAVLGNSGGDPNPYVVFVACLIGAVYSEDVWAWARKRGLTMQTEDQDQSEKHNEKKLDLGDTETERPKGLSSNNTVAHP